jgi:hypothetical protein
VADADEEAERPRFASIPSKLAPSLDDTGRARVGSTGGLNFVGELAGGVTKLKKASVPPPKVLGDVFSTGARPNTRLANTPVGVDFLSELKMGNRLKPSAVANASQTPPLPDAAQPKESPSAVSLGTLRSGFSKPAVVLPPPRSAPATPTLQSKPPEPPNKPIGATPTSPLPPTPSLGAGASAGGKEEEQVGLPKWKQVVIDTKAQKAVPPTAEELLRMEQDKKYEGLPEWKRKVLIEKEKKELEKRGPELAAQRALEERQAKLAAMPEWKRKLAETKQM